ncbi:class I SAM-dependent methyltransferase [Sphingoaurantiacus capsulatus]|uniref:Class I SAM-dependent methyltransferase n=1 Tax=Sphingoaurantiacus capsulatus TaxID=1771310 RepID=A0ABV7X5V2_9SPHN
MERAVAVGAGGILERTPSKGEQLMLFAKNFVKHPKMLGSVIPSSRFLIDKLLAPVDWANARLFVEYGPGIGNISAEVLRRMHPDAKLVLFELNDDFTEFLKTAFRDPRLIVLHRSAADVGRVLAEAGLGKADYIISGIPFSTMPEGVRNDIADATHAALAPGGQFLVYQFSPKVLEVLEPRFARIDRDFEAINVPPAQLYFAHR